jgi:hypothetical protein
METQSEHQIALSRKKSPNVLCRHRPCEPSVHDHPSYPFSEILASLVDKEDWLDMCIRWSERAEFRGGVVSQIGENNAYDSC